MHHQLKRDAVRGIGWAFFSSVSVRLLQIVTTLMLAKLLMPADFGIFSLASIITNAMLILPDIGFAQALIYQQGDIRKSANTAFLLSTGTSALLATLLFIGAPMLGKAFGIAAIVMPMRVMAGTLVISGATTVPMALLDKNLKFSKRAIPEVSAAFTYATVSITLAALGYRSWSMVIGWTAMSVTSAIATWCVSKWRPSLEFCPEGSRVILNYGKHLAVATMAAFFFLQIDKAAVGKWLGVTALGFYSIAFTVCNLPATNLTAVVNRVMFPLYSKLDGDISEIGKVYLKTIRHLASAAFPAAVGLMVIPGPFIRLFYGQKWEGAIPLFRVLAIYGLIRALGATSDAVFMATGRPRLVRKVTMTQLVVGGTLVYPVARSFGVVGVAILFTIAYLSGTLYGLANVRRILGLHLSDWGDAMRSPAIAAAVAGISASAVSTLFSRMNFTAVAAISAVTVLAYLAVILLVDRSSVREIRSTLAGASKRGTQ
jgi:O-antigen/teichoic acid export membrane protein